MSIQLTFDKEFYEERTKEKLNNLLDSDFLKTEPYSLNDDNLEICFSNRSNNYIQPESYTEKLDIVANNFCTIGKVDGHITNEYNGIVFDRALISFGENKTLAINYSDFRSMMHPIVSAIDDSFQKKRMEDYDCHSMISGTYERISDIFLKASNARILFSYCFPACNYYNKERNCYRLYMLSDQLSNYNILRGQLLISQCFVLNHILRYPSLYALMTRAYVNGNSSHWGVWSEPVNFFVKIFNRDFRLVFDQKLKEKTEMLGRRNIAPIDCF